MILINLLPHREEAKKARADAFKAYMLVAAFAGGLIAGLVYLSYEMQISNQDKRNTELVAANTQLDLEIKQVATLEKEIAGLKARQQAVENIQAERNLPVYLLNELVKRVPDGMVINSIKQENTVVSVNGISPSNERVAEFLRNLSNNNSYISSPELIEIVAGTTNISAKEQRKVSNFVVKFQFKNKVEAVTTTIDAGTATPHAVVNVPNSTATPTPPQVPTPVATSSSGVGAKL